MRNQHSKVYKTVINRLIRIRFVCVLIERKSVKRVTGGKSPFLQEAAIGHV